MDISQLINSFSDADFCNRLMENPRQTLGSVGIDVPASKELKVLRNSAKTLNLVVPSASSLSGSDGKDMLLPDEDLDKISAGETIIAMSVVLGVALLGGIATIATVAGVFGSGLADD